MPHILIYVVLHVRCCMLNIVRTFLLHIKNIYSQSAVLRTITDETLHVKCSVVEYIYVLCIETYQHGADTNL
jgi:hypothetical protein